MFTTQLSLFDITTSVSIIHDDQFIDKPHVVLKIHTSRNHMLTNTTCVTATSTQEQGTTSTAITGGASEIDNRAFRTTANKR